MAFGIVTEEQIRTTAYYIWLEEGQPEGDDEAHWHRARAMLEAAADDTGGPAAKRGSPRAKTRSAAPAPAQKTTRMATARKTAAKTRSRQDA